MEIEIILLIKKFHFAAG